MLASDGASVFSTDKFEGDSANQQEFDIFGSGDYAYNDEFSFDNEFQFLFVAVETVLLFCKTVNKCGEVFLLLFTI